MKRITNQGCSASPAGALRLGGKKDGTLLHWVKAEKLPGTVPTLDGTWEKSRCVNCEDLRRGEGGSWTV